ncbi:6-phosphofructokinase [Egicoccus halophilus]|uniref:6-phosphofructokinase n=1 Tax=Egicoccus halophilus TaxID=1670830 RepID=A0A8J3AD05_9ACTN|nr:6-phosphofructokinase [Egicoccus halophilus]GGI09289.1 6-phosphofructokinase [Egicoccus halophilus]
MRIGILTGGGDVPGTNRCLKAFVERVAHDGHEVVGIRRGWAGLLDYDPDEPDASAERTLVTLDRERVRTIDRSGGTVLHTSRVDPSRVQGFEVPWFLAGRQLGDGPYDLTPHVLRVVDALRLDALVAIGGHDTLSYALRLHHEGVPIVGVPKTMDNDVHGTDYCLGFSTAVTRSVEFIHQLRTSTGSHEHIAVVELFGRHSGETSLVSAYLASVDRALICEVPFDPERLAALLVEDRRRNPSRYAMVTVSEGAYMTGEIPDVADPLGPRETIGAATGAFITHLTGQDVIVQSLGYLMRSGGPDSLDLMVATNFAVMAGDLTLDEERGRLVGLQSGTYGDVPLDVIDRGVKRVDVASLYDAEAYRPTVRTVVDKPMFLY